MNSHFFAPLYMQLPLFVQFRSPLRDQDKLRTGQFAGHYNEPHTSNFYQVTNQSNLLGYQAISAGYQAEKKVATKRHQEPIGT